MTPSVKLFSIDWQVWVLRYIFDVVGHRQSYDVSRVMYPFVKQLKLKGVGQLIT